MTEILIENGTITINRKGAKKKSDLREYSYKIANNGRLMLLKGNPVQLMLNEVITRGISVNGTTLTADNADEILEPLFEGSGCCSKPLLPEPEEIKLDSALIPAGLPGFYNSNGRIYYQVRARDLGEETEFIVCDRDGAILVTAVSAYNCVVFNLIMGSFLENKFQYGFSKDEQAAYIAEFNQVIHTSYKQNSDGSSVGQTIQTLIQTLELCKNTGSDDYTVIGEFFFTPYFVGDAGTERPIFQSIVPTPKN